MARKKLPPTHYKKTYARENANSFPTMFFESTSAQETPAHPAASHPKNSPSSRPSFGSRAERLIWMWCGVVIVMMVVLFAWTRSLNANGILNFRAWFQKDNLIQESRQSIKYYFEKQNQNQAEMNAVTASLLPSAAATNPILDANKINQLKNKIASLSATTTSSVSTSLPPSLNKK